MWHSPYTCSRTLLVFVIRVPTQTHDHGVYLASFVADLRPAIVDAYFKLGAHCVQGFIGQVGCWESGIVKLLLTMTNNI